MTSGQVRAGGWRAVAADAGLAGAGVLAVAMLHVRDPHAHGSWGFCPFHELTGWWCPACGGLRAVNDLTNGHVVAALHSNVLLLPFVATVLLLWGRHVFGRWQGRALRPMIRFTPRAGTVIWVALAAFTVFRNTPWGHWLAPA